MPGTRPSPVRLDPFKWISGIHWADDDRPVTHLALKFRLQPDGQVLQFKGEDPPSSGSEPPPDEYYGGEYLASIAMRYFAASIFEGPQIRAVLAWDGEEWFSTLSTLEVTGLPRNPASPFLFNQLTLGEDEIASQATGGFTQHWVDPDGGEIAIPVPNDPEGRMFKAGGASLEMFGRPFTGDKFAYQTGSFDPVWLYLAGSAAPVAWTAFPPAIEVTHAGKPFSVIGARVVPYVSGALAFFMPRDSADPGAPGELWVLCEAVTG